MTEPPLIANERTILHELTRLSAERHRAEVETTTTYKTRKEALERETQETKQRLRGDFESERSNLEKEYQETQRNLSARFKSEYATAEKECATVRERFRLEFETQKEAVEKKHKESAWSANTVFEANRQHIEELVGDVKKKTGEAMDHIAEIQKQAEEMLDEWNQDATPPKAAASVKIPRGPEAQVARIQERLKEAENLVEQLGLLQVPRLFQGERLLFIFIAGWFLLIAALMVGLLVSAKMKWIATYASGWPQGWYIWLGAGTAIYVTSCVTLRFWLSRKADAQVAALFVPLCQYLAEARHICKRCQEETAESLPRLHAENKRRNEKEALRVREKYQHKLAGVQESYDAEVRQLESTYPRVLADIKKSYDKDLRQVNGKYPPLLTARKKRFDDEMLQLQQKYDQTIAGIESAHKQGWETLIKKWNDGMGRMLALIKQTQTEDRQYFGDWSQVAGTDWMAPKTLPPALRFGTFQMGRALIANAQPLDPARCATVPETIRLPALLPFPQGGSLLLKAGDQGRDAAIPVLQAVMLRYLTCLPPAAVRFTIVDPVGLGENFAGFMHLADADELLVTSRIWTEAGHIEQRLADLTEHMEKVIQKFLRNQFATLAEYNVQAGEVAEPYRILVVANFPANFTEAAARRLVSIASGGAACGVLTLISVDANLTMPNNFQLRDLEQSAVVLNWQENRFAWKDPDFARLPLQLEAPPGAGVTAHILQVVGEKARIAGRVEVPFTVVAPPDNGWWTSDSRAGIRVPLGRAGAAKLQYLDLGKGTSQHVLIAGKTGSGKSTFLHALITNLALHYSPHEVELFLIDFKKGVEFKTYATERLPHARVVAIESEREFGLSVLQRLDVELRERGERFRAAGVQDLTAYRNEHPKEVLPRIMLVVDEFQEFFTEDDRIAQETGLLMDRLVRQGRAFGIHVLLGSQTLGGAYSLARSTLGQMAVRIALQCSETDAGLILSDDNTAARLLTRPGEAIYNDANGRVEGNDFFQIVWLNDNRREEYLQKLHSLAEQRHMIPQRPQIVFEGNTPADLSGNHLLQAMLDAPPPVTRSLHAWLGEAIAIKDPTSATFRLQSGSNLLVLGQQEEPAMALITALLVSLGAQLRGRAEPGRLVILDSTPPDTPFAGWLGQVAAVLPVPAHVAGFREIPALIGEVAAELERRQQNNVFDATPWFVCISGLQRFRDLRRGEDDFGFGRDSQAATPAQQFSAVLRDGPSFGIHVVVWCDALANVLRSVDRQGLREFEMKVLFQMSNSDSSLLIDSPAASRLGVHRALFHTEESGQPEKFRPYALPDADWLEQLRERLHSSAASLSEPRS